MSNPNDIIRDSILRYLYDVHQKARSPKSAAQGIKDITSGMKSSGHGYKLQQISSNLDYLIQKGWVKEIIEERKFRTTKGTEQNSEKRLYKISASGIDKLESASTYQRSPLQQGVNITNIHGVTVLGDGNVVNTNFTDLSNVLNELRKVVLESNTIGNTEKLCVASDIETLQAQLQKPEPDKTIIQKVWSGIEKIVTATEFSQLAYQASQLLIPLLS